MIGLLLVVLAVHQLNKSRAPIDDRASIQATVYFVGAAIVFVLQRVIRRLDELIHLHRNRA